MDKETIKNLNEEQIRKAMACDTPEELVALAKAEGVDLTQEEAEAYLCEMEDINLDVEQMKQVAGGKGVCYGVGDCWGRTSSTSCRER